MTVESGGGGETEGGVKGVREAKEREGKGSGTVERHGHKVHTRK